MLCVYLHAIYMHHTQANTKLHAHQKRSFKLDLLHAFDKFVYKLDVFACRSCLKWFFIVLCVCLRHNCVYECSVTCNMLVCMKRLGAVCACDRGVGTRGRDLWARGCCLLSCLDTIRR